MISKWSQTQYQEQASRINGFCQSQPRRLRRSLSHDGEELRHDILGEEPDYPENESEEEDQGVNLSTLSEMRHNLSNERTQGHSQGGSSQSKVFSSSPKYYYRLSIIQEFSIAAKI
jgi:hypothetical protein